MNLNYREVKEVGQFRSVRVWQDTDHDGHWILDAERLDGTLGTQDWSFEDLDDLLFDLPLFVAVLVRGVVVTIRPGVTKRDQAQAPAIWIVTIPIAGGGKEVSEWPSRQAAEKFLRSWVLGRAS